MSIAILIGTEERERLTQRVKDALTELRPFLEADGGDITLVDISEKGVVRVRLHGACSSCSMSAMTMKAGVEEAIKRVAPEVVKVEAVK
ncbi:MAG: NifU family protein [Flavobacteriales bacterium]|jgi:Fe-S cluster biogenesis protein NfuA|nr:NifU family protein [Flavobacteriales bacterium]MBK6893231.1 NifU family protein [Flavobacteriales bacterium]MBK7249037.1 NifU family protein [Flavobacteriales bacterium]MBK7285609.1 NifU family protein [Flavobacteriales bacterium]MBK9058719.1 NifU family protein [Flavobacteriales bacterium]